MTTTYETTTIDTPDGLARVTRVTDTRLAERIPTHTRRCWVAELTGPDPKYRIRREFLRKTKTAGVWGVTIEHAGVYQWSTKRYGSPTPETGLEIWSGTGWRTFDADLTELAKRVPGDVLQTIIDRAPGRRDDACTLCDADLEHFTSDGWPTCETHFDVLNPPTISQPDETQPVPF